MDDSRSGPAPVVLVIEDEAPIRRFLRAGLEGQGYALVEAATAQEGVTEAATRAPDLVLLDLGLPDADGLEVVRRVREWSATPIIVLTARDREGDKVRALDAGADDYITKPFSMPELLTTLARHAGRVLTHDFLLREVWGPGARAQHHYLRVYMAQLRHKLEADPARPRLLLTEIGVGYRMAEPA
jgi:two-component system KDP operon response regulator KdpE